MEQFYNKYKDNDSKAPDYGINFYNDNLIFFKNVNHFRDEQEFLLFVEIYSLCIKSFVDKKQYKNANNALDLMPVIESTIDGFKIERSGFNNYKLLSMQKAMSLYYLKDYVASKKILKQLLKYEPQNDFLKNWLEHAQIGVLQRYPLYFIIIGAALLVGEHFTENSVSAIINHICAFIAGACLLLYIGTTIYLQRKRNK